VLEREEILEGKRWALGTNHAKMSVRNKLKSSCYIIPFALCKKDIRSLFLTLFLSPVNILVWILKYIIGKVV